MSLQDMVALKCCLQWKDREDCTKCMSHVSITLVLLLQPFRLPSTLTKLLPLVTMITNSDNKTQKECANANKDSLETLVTPVHRTTLVLTVRYTVTLLTVKTSSHTSLMVTVMPLTATMLDTVPVTVWTVKHQWRVVHWSPALGQPLMMLRTTDILHQPLTPP